MTRSEAAKLADVCREMMPGAVCGAGATWATLTARIGDACHQMTRGEFSRGDFSLRARQVPLFEEEQATISAGPVRPLKADEFGGLTFPGILETGR